MPGNYDITAKTYIRRDDRIEEEELNDILFQKFVETYTGQEWYVQHNLRSSNLLITLWKFDETSPAAFWKINQLDYNNLVVHWTMPCVGKCVLYSVKPFVGVSHIHTQATAATMWTISHNLGTEDIIFTCWDDTGTHVVPSVTKIIDVNTVELYFPTATAGTAVFLIADPAISTSIGISWTSIIAKPAVYPPASHTHDASEITNLSVSSLGGHPIDDFLLVEHLGIKVPPLEYENVGDTQKTIPAKYLPKKLPVLYGDSGGDIRAVKLIIDDKNKSPLYLGKDTTKQEATLKIYPVVRKLWLMGNVTYNAYTPDKCIEASSDYLMRLQVGPGLMATALDRNTLQISTASGVAKAFTRTSLLNGATWTITDSIFAVPGNYNLALFEMEPSIITGTNESRHIWGETQLSSAFEIHGDDIMDISGPNGNIVTDKILHNVDHFVYNDAEFRDSTGSLVLAPSDTDALYYDPVNKWFIARSNSMGNYVYRAIRPSDKAIIPLNTCAQTDLPYWNAICGGMVYMMEPTATGFRVVRDALSNMPIWSWTVHADFPSEAMPTIMMGGEIKFRCNSNYLVVLNTETNSLAVYDIAAGTMLFDNPLPDVAKDFDLWDDNYVSISFVGTNYLCKSDRPIWDPSYSFEPSIDSGMGICEIFAISSDDIGGAMGVKDNVSAKHLWWGPISSMAKRPVYACGETTLWLQATSAWNISPLWSKVYNLSWEDYDFSNYEEVKIGFYPGTFATLPPLLYKWNGTSFVSFPSSDLPTLGQSLSDITTMELAGNTSLSYAIYIKKKQENTLLNGYMVNNIHFRYQELSSMYPVPLGGPSNTDHLLVKCIAGSVVLTNTLGRDLSGLRLVVVPVVIS